MTISNHATVIAAKGRISCNIADEAVILNLDNSVYYGTDPVGGRIWELLQDGGTVAKIHDILLSEYEVEPDRCAEDLIKFLCKLREEGLIEVSDEKGEKISASEQG